MIKNLNEMQNFSVKVVKELDKIRGAKHDKDVAMHHLVEEVGELAKEIYNDKTGRNRLNKENLGGEVFDIIVLASYLAYLYGIKLEDAFDFKLKDFKKRFNLKV